MREIVLDTETTGIGTAEHRVIEIGAVEIISKIPTGEKYHVFINPEREIEAGAMRVHGISNERVAEEPKFAELADGFLEFLGDSPLVAHNAKFDVDFLNMELERAGKAVMSNQIIDTLSIARKTFPGARATLDALCSRFEVDLSVRTLHGALLDAELLAEVYLNLCGGLQRGLELDSSDSQQDASGTKAFNISTLQGKQREIRNFPVNDDELTIHQEYISQINDAIWGK